MTELLDGINISELRGRRTKAVSAIFVRPITEPDLVLLSSGVRKVTPASPITKLRDRHHAVARLIANGHTNAYVSLITGMDPARISVLRSDPTFKELVSDYAKIDAGMQADFVERAGILSLTAMEEMQDRLENSEEPVPMQTLIEVAKFGADRTGHGPVAKTSNVNVNVELSSRLASARKRLVSVPALEAPSDAVFTDKD